MAIQTGGYGVQVMPQVAAPNPSLLAFNPALIAEGVGDPFRLADQYNKIQAFKKAQAEQDLLAKFRIKTAEKELKERAAKADLGTEQAGAALPQVKDEAALRGLQIGNLARSEVDKLAVADQTTAATVANAEVAARQAESKAATVAQEHDLRVQQLNNLALAAKNETNTLVSNGILDPKKAELDLIKLNDGIKNAQTDLERGRLLQDYNIKLIDAQIGKLKSESDGEANQFKKLQKLEMLNGALDRQMNAVGKIELTLPDGKIGNIADYMNQAIDEEGKPKDAKGWFTGDVKISSDAKIVLNRIAEIRKKQASLSQQMADMYVVEGETPSDNKETQSDDRFKVGLVYPGTNGSQAKYLGKGKWEVLK